MSTFESSVCAFWMLKSVEDLTPNSFEISSSEFLFWENLYSLFAKCVLLSSMQKSFKQLLASLFRELRKQKIYAKQKFSCCRTCSWSEFENPYWNGMFVFTTQEHSNEYPDIHLYWGSIQEDFTEEGEKRLRKRIEAIAKGLWFSVKEPRNFGDSINIYL